MALSDREQQMLDEIESALNEDAEFTKSVREVSNPSQKHAHHTQHATAWGWTLIAVGVVLLFAGFFCENCWIPPAVIGRFRDDVFRQHHADPAF